MEAEFKQISEISDSEAQAMYDWLYSPKNRFYSTVCSSPDAKPSDLDWQALQQRINHSRAIRYGIYQQNEFIGEFNFVFDHVALIKRHPKSAWFGIGIGKQTARRNGIGTKVMRFVEEQIIEHGGERLEFGVFEYNLPAISFYKKLGYKQFETIPNKTWWEGRRWADFRFEKNLKGT